MHFLAILPILLVSVLSWAADQGHEPRTPEALDALGRREFAEGRYRSAIRYFERVLKGYEAEPAGRVAALGNVGQSCVALGEYRRAEEYFREALGIRPESAPLWHRLGQALFLQNRRADAEAAYRRALRNGGDDPDIWSDLATILQAERRWEEAIGLLRDAAAASQTGQNRARILRNLGVLEWKMGARDTAADHLRQALTEMEASVGPDHPDVAQVLDDYSEVLARMGEKGRSREAAKRAESIRSAFAARAPGATVGWRELRK